MHLGRTDVSVIAARRVCCVKCERVLQYTHTLGTAHTPHRSYYAAIKLTSVRPPLVHIEPSV